MSQTLSNSFFLGRFLSQLASRLADFLFPLAIYLHSGSLALSGFALAIEWLPRVLGSPLCGALADRYRGGRLLVFADVARALLGIVPFFSMEIATLLCVSAVFGFLSALSQLTLERVVASSEGSIQRTQLTLEIINNLAFVLGSAVASVLIIYLNLNTVFLAISAIFLCSMPCVWNVGQRATCCSRFSLLSDVSLALSLLSSRRALRRVIASGFLISIVFGIVTSTGPAMVMGTFELGKKAFGHAQVGAALATVIIVLTSQLIPGIALQRHKIGFMAIAVGLAGVVISPTFAIWMTSYAIFSAGIAMFLIYLRCARIALIPVEHFGKALGVIMVLTIAGLPIGGLLVAALASLLPTRAVIALAVPLFAAAVFVLARRHASLPNAEKT